MIGSALPEHVKVPEGAMVVWVIYDHPRDYPHGFVLRPQFAVSGEVRACPQAWYARSADELRSILPHGVTYLPRQPQDDVAILETWL